MAGRQVLTVKGLQPNSIYSIQVYARKTTPDGLVTHSPSTTTSITTPANTASGSNFKVTNNGTDIQLAGGTLYAGTFDDNLGQLDPLAGSSNGIIPAQVASSNYGVALNQFGIAAYNAGVPEFYIDSRTGNAYFAGTVTATQVNSTNYIATTASSEPLYTTTGTQIDLNNGTISTPNFRIDTSGNLYLNGAISGTSTIAGVNASTLLGYAEAGAAISNTALQMIGTNISNASGQIQAINANGTTFYSGNSQTHGSRILINSYGILGYNSNSQSNSDGVSFAILSSSQSVNGTTLPAGSAYFSGVIQGSTFTSSNYGGSGTGFAIASNGAVDSINFSYGGSVGAYISSNGSSAMTIAAVPLGTSFPTTYIQIGNAPTSSVVVSNGTVSYGGSVGHVRNIWANTSSGLSVPTANSTVTTLAGMLTDPKEGDIYLVWA